MIDKRPALIARCAGSQDVVACVNFARNHDVLISVRGGGHNFAGKAVCDGGLMIDLSAMKGIEIDPEQVRRIVLSLQCLQTVIGLWPTPCRTRSSPFFRASSSSAFTRQPGLRKGLKVLQQSRVTGHRIVFAWIVSTG